MSQLSVTLLLLLVVMWYCSQSLFVRAPPIVQLGQFADVMTTACLELISVSFSLVSTTLPMLVHTAQPPISYVVSVGDSVATSL